MPAEPVINDRIAWAIALRLVSAACIATMGAFIKLAQASGADLVEILFVRQIIGIPLVAAVIAFGPGLGIISTKRLGKHVLRSVLGLASMACLFTSVMLLPLAEATTLSFTVPIFATILGALILKEATGRHRWSAVAAGFVGVLIVAHPGAGNFPLWGAVAGISAALLNASVTILLRQLGRTEHPFAVVFWFTTLSSIPVAIAFAVAGEHNLDAAWPYLLGIALCGICGQLALTAALKYSPVSLVVPMDYSSLVWATLYGWILFAVLPGPATWVGAPLIVGSGLYIVWREHKLRKRRLSS